MFYKRGILTNESYFVDSDYTDTGNTLFTRFFIVQSLDHELQNRRQRPYRKDLWSILYRLFSVFQEKPKYDFNFLSSVEEGMGQRNLNEIGSSVNVRINGSNVSLYTCLDSSPSIWTLSSSCYMFNPVLTRYEWKKGRTERKFKVVLCQNLRFLTGYKR